jgi:hypothetical protein
VYLALLAAARQIFLVNADSLGNFNGTALFVLALSSLVFLLTNRKLRNPLLGYIGVFSGVLTILWGYFFLFHTGEAFTLWPPEIAHDMWIFLSLLSLGLVCFSHGISRRTSGNFLYAPPMWCAAALIYCWTLLKVLPAFISLMFGGSAEFYEIWLFLILGITLSPLLKPLPGAAHWRGGGILIMLTGFVVSSLSFATLRWKGIPEICWGFALWGFANGILPRFNARFSQWQVSPATWPWAGLLLTAAGIYEMGIFGQQHGD